MNIYQQTKDCSDFDVAIENEEKPSFRVLLLEWIMAGGVAESYRVGESTFRISALLSIILAFVIGY
jgi:hypothetical protein